ncbi:MAG: hypothetical protein AB8B87_07785 [Granulosicoccus sp.]
MQAPSFSFSIHNLALAIFIAAFSPAAMANQCGDISPRLSDLGEQYYILDEQPKSVLSHQATSTNELIETLQSTRFKAGRGERTLCFGASTLREQIREFKLESIEPASINSYNELMLKAYEYDSEKKISHRTTVFIPLLESSISLIGNDGFVANLRHKQPVRGFSDNSGLNRGIHLREIAITGQSNHNGVEIHQSIYVNGRLAEWFTWNLDS